MRPEQKSFQLLGITRSKAKMYEYDVPTEYHIEIKQDPAKLFTISIGLLGDLAAMINRGDTELDSVTELKNNLLFSARFFDSYLQSQLNETLDPYLVLLASASYYLCDLPGSAAVLAKQANGECLDLGGACLENLLLWLLQADIDASVKEIQEPYGKFILGIIQHFIEFYENGTGEDRLLEWGTRLRTDVYKFGTPRELLLGDVIVAVLRKKIENSVWKALPSYSGLSRDTWLDALKKDSSIKELWPAQHLLGKANVLKGDSAIVQMPTSAGKTKATELILRSAFLAERISLAIIVAPFRALCHEIKNSLSAAFHNEKTRIDELSDTLQNDFDIDEILSHQQVLVVTPEKLLFVLRHTPELADHVGLLIFDEGHQFDSGTRGITYELLLTSLRSMIPEECQKVLISAVIGNAKAVGEWLNGNDNIVEGTTLIPTFRSVGFASWPDLLGRIEYVNARNIDQDEFYVPRVIEKLQLNKKGKEENDRFFPERDDSLAMALYLGLKLVSNGSVSIFCGKKVTAASICEKAFDVLNRDVPLSIPIDYSDAQEVKRLAYLYEKHLGKKATATQTALLGIFSHHGNTPHGIRLAVEHAMRENLIRFVVCTSTLAQGVNLPIRYLIVTSVYQGTERIKVRDFHNLIGRAGRAGMHTEGSILFADTVVYDKKRSRSDGWRWNIVRELMDPAKSEECVSSLFQLIPLTIRNDRNKSADKKNHVLNWDILTFASAYIDGKDSLAAIIDRIVNEHSSDGFTVETVTSQFDFISQTLSSIESFLLSNWDVTEYELSAEEVAILAEQTLAYYLADDEKKIQVKSIFQLLANNISVTISDPKRRKVFGKTLYGVNDARAIEEWVASNADKLLEATSEEEIFNLLWPLIAKYIHNHAFQRFDNKGILKKITYDWICGIPFWELFQLAKKNDCRLGKGKRPRKVKIENIIDICEGGISYDGGLLINVVCEFLSMLNYEGSDDLIKQLQLLQKRIKYGLPTDTAIGCFELGFSDRVISQELAISLNISETKRNELIRKIKQNKSDARTVITKYPLYFQERLRELAF